MKEMFIGFGVGLLLAVCLGLSWKSAVTSGDAFTVGTEQFYTCRKVKVFVE